MSCARPRLFSGPRWPLASPLYPRRGLWKRLAAAIQSQWDRTGLHLPANTASNHAFEWIVWTVDRARDGSLDKAGQVVHLTGNVEDCAHFATWSRGLVPARCTLVFDDEGYSAEVELTVGTKESELVEPFLAQ